MAERVIKLFGEPEVTLDGRTVELGAALPLLAVLILWRDQPSVGMSGLVELLHQKALRLDSETNEPSSCLRKRKGILREKLDLELPRNIKPSKNAPAILEQAWVDVACFDEKIDSPDSRQVREAVELRQRGPLLAHWQEPGGVEKARASREKKYQAALWRLIQEERLIHPKEAVHYVDLLLGLEGLPSKRHEVLDELRLELEHVVLRKPENSAAPQPVEEGRLAKPVTLPYPTVEVIGRESEVAAIKNLLRQPGLVTLTGTAGIGKTRLACALVAALHQSFPDGYAFADLSTLTEATQVAQKVGISLGLAQGSGRTWSEVLLAFLEQKKLLLVWDNCEHLVEACAELAADVLARCPSVHLLATSREALRVYGEQSYQVPALSPDGAAQLFLARARAVKSDFQCTETDRAAVMKICLDLDRLPLAIELAASLVYFKKVKWIADNLDKRFEVLVDSPRAGSPRHPSLQAAFDLSYNLLHSAEKELFRHLGVFAGSFGMDAVEAVSTTGTNAARLLPQLVRKSLVMAEEHDDEMRFRLLVTVRKYAQDRLREQGEEDETRRWHRIHFLALAEEAAPQLRGPDQKRWLDRLETEHDNLLAALDWRADEAGLRMACALQRFWWVRGYLAEGRKWLEREVDDNAGVSDALRAEVLIRIGRLAQAQGEFADAQKLYEQSRAIQIEQGNQQGLADALFSLGTVAEHLGNYADAIEKHEESLRLCLALGDEHGVANAWYGLAIVSQNQDDDALAISRHEQSLSLRRKLGDVLGISSSLSGLGALVSTQGRWEDAKAYLEECFTWRQSLGQRRGIANSLVALGELAQVQGDYEEARQKFDESLTMFQALGDRYGSADALHHLGCLAYDTGDYDHARDIMERCLTLLQALRDKSGIAILTNNLGSVARHQLRLTEANRLLTESLLMFEQLDSQSGIANSLGEFAFLAAAEGTPQRAAQLWSAEEKMSALIGCQRPANEAGRRQQALSNVQKVLGAEAFAAAWAQGQELMWEHAVSFVLADATN